MKKILRKNTFETNSSSSHSLVIKKQDNYIVPDVYLNKHNKIKIYRRELDFGRIPEAPLVSFYDKLRYLIASYSNNDKKINEIINEVINIIPKCEGIEFSEIGEAYNFETKEYKYDDSPYYGYVDHQSMCLLPSYLENNNISIKEFLTNGRYVVVIDGDEYGMYDAFKESGLINLDIIEREIN